MVKKVISQRKRLAAIFASFSILVMGTLSLAESMSLDYYSVVNTLEKVIPASLVLGGLGWVMGMVLDRPKKTRRTNYNSLFLSDMMKNELAEEKRSDSEEFLSEAKPEE